MEKIEAPAKPIGSGYAPAVANRSFRRQKRCETPSQRGGEHQLAPHIGRCRNYKRRHNKKRRSAALAPSHFQM